MYKMIIQNQKNKMAYDVSTIVHDIEHFTTIYSQPGKLSFILEKDTNEILQLCEGNDVLFFSGKNKLFKGKIFNIGTDSTEAYRVVAYDNTRYLKNRDTIFVENQTIDQLFSSICRKNSISLNSVKFRSMYIMQSKLYNDKTYFEILNDAITETLQKDVTKPYFFIKDNFGVLELNELKNAKTTYIIGDESLLMDYKYEVDIDNDTYNRIKIMSGSEKEGLTIETIEQDVKTIAEYGVLQKLVTVQTGTTQPQIKQFAKLYLQLKNKAKKTIQLEAMGVEELNAGNGFIFELKKLGIKKTPMYITSATHHYNANQHTMSLEVSGYSSSLF